MKLKILHIALSCHYTENMAYQENIIPDINVEQGHDVLIVSDNFSYSENELIELSPTEHPIMLSSGVKLLRLKYDKIVHPFITQKIKRVTRLKSIIFEYEPDIIYYHDISGYELLTVADYVKNHPNVLFWADNHSDYNNSSRTMIAKIINKIVHGYFIRKAMVYIEKVLCVSTECMKYMSEMYGVSEEKLEWYPLGGILIDFNRKKSIKKKITDELGLPEDVVLFAHSGKLTKGKKTIELLNALKVVPNEKIALLIFGSIPDDEYSALYDLIKDDSRVFFLGWRNSDDMLDILGGVDVYCQPGTQSATLQIAICSGCAVIMYPYKSHDMYYCNNGYFVTNEKELSEAILKICSNSQILEKMKENSWRFAEKYLDYNRISERIYAKN